jgi:DNA polymerase (family 10)
MAVKKGLKINEYGVFKNGKSIAGTTEFSVYATVGLSFISPELRENRGEIEAAKLHSLPQLVELNDLKGDLHTHTNATDGKNSLLEMAEAAKKFGLDYIANTDHSKRMTMSHGFDVVRLRKQLHAIDTANSKLNGITILKGIEVDILEDGSLDLPDYILNQLDVVVASIHTHFKLSREKQTARLLKAINNPTVTMIGHLTGRLINERPGYDIDIETIFKAIKSRGCFIELDSDPARLDIDDIHCKMAKDMGILVSINSDAHSTNGFKNLEYGIGQARRGWLEKKDVLNSRPLSELKKLLASTH